MADLKETGGHITNQEIPHQPALEAGNNEFRELFKQITLEIQAMKDDGESITKEEQQRIIKEIIKWKRVQEEFYLGQQFDLEQILEKNPTINKNPESADKLKNAIRGRFKDFSTITHGLRQEYLDLVNKLGFIDESGQPLLDQISALEQRIGELNNEISLMLPNLEKLANQKQILTDQLNELIKQFDEKMATQTEEDFLTAIHAIGY